MTHKESGVEVREGGEEVEVAAEEAPEEPQPEDTQEATELNDQSNDNTVSNNQNNEQNTTSFSHLSLQTPSSSNYHGIHWQEQLMLVHLVHLSIF